MSRYYAIVNWTKRVGRQVILVKLKSTCKDLRKVLSEDGNLDISKHVDKILINNAPNINFYRTFKLNKKINDFSKSPALYWSFKERISSEEKLTLLKIFTGDNDRLEKFDSDDDAKLWFELNYNI